MTNQSGPVRRWPCLSADSWKSLKNRCFRSEHKWIFSLKLFLYMLSKLFNIVSKWYGHFGMEEVLSNLRHIPYFFTFTFTWVFFSWKSIKIAFRLLVYHITSIWLFCFTNQLAFKFHSQNIPSHNSGWSCSQSIELENWKATENKHFLCISYASEHYHLTHYAYATHQASPHISCSWKSVIFSFNITSLHTCSK